VDAPERSPGEALPTAELLERVIEEARGGGPAARARLRAYLDAYPKLWQTLGDLASLVERSWLGGSSARTRRWRRPRCGGWRR
jgi:hypothetical protein